MTMQPHSKKRVCYYYDSEYELMNIYILMHFAWLIILAGKLAKKWEINP